MFRILTDSTCDLSSEQLKIKDMIPLQVILEDTSYRDKVEIDTKAVYAHINAGKSIKTSLPHYQDFYEKFEFYAKQDIPFIYLAFSSALSGTHNFSLLVLKDIKEKYPHVKAHIVNSKAGGLGLGLLFSRLLTLKQSGASFDEVVSEAEKLSGHVEHIFMVNNLAQLVKGGRITSLKAIIGGLLNIRPILKLDALGAIKPHKNAIGMRRGINEVAQYVISNCDKDTLIGINYADNTELASQMESTLRKHGYTQFIKEPIGSVFAAHIGSNAVGVYFIR